MEGRSKYLIKSHDTFGFLPLGKAVACYLLLVNKSMTWKGVRIVDTKYAMFYWCLVADISKSVLK